MPAEPDARPETTGHAERVFYRNDDEFNTQLDAASESIRKAAGPDLVGNALWWAVIGALVAFHLSDWVFDLDLSQKIIPGIDLKKPTWVALGALFLMHHITTRHRHGRILRQRLCFTCGRSLLRAPVDEHGDGTCPKCDRAFNLGEYRRPNQNRGRDFHGYIDGAHFDNAMNAAAERIRESGSAGLHASIMGWAWIALGVSFGLKIVLDWNLFEWLPEFIPVHAIWLIVLVVWGAVHSARSRRLLPSIVERRRCLDCGFCLLHTPIDDEGLGRCPECGTAFAIAAYERPAIEDADAEVDENDA